MTTLNKSDLQKCAEQSGLRVDGRSEFAYTDRLERFSRLIRLDLELEITYLRDHLAKAEQLWQVAQGRCDGLEEKLAKAEQRVAEACKSMCLSLVRKENNHIASYGPGYLFFSAQDVADFIDSGEWRKYEKDEV